MTREYTGDMVKDLDGLVYEMHPVGCCDQGCSSCCANGMFCFLTYGSHLCVSPTFTMHISEDGKSGVGKEATICGCLPMSPIPCCNGCGIGPCAFVSPFDIVDAEGGKKWVGSGQVCAAGLCPCMNNVGDWGLHSPETDGSSAEKFHRMYPVSAFWPPCVNGMLCGKDQPAFKIVQQGVGKPKGPIKAPVEWKGDVKEFGAIEMEMYPIGCCETGCQSCCAHSLLCFMSCGTMYCCAPSFTFYPSEDGKRMVGKNATFAGCFKISPLPCFQGCGFGPCAFTSPGAFTEIDGGLKWTGDGQIVAGGCCPCLTNAGDWNTITASNDGSSQNKYGEFYPMSMAWPPCVNGMMCNSKDKPGARYTQKGVGPPIIVKITKTNETATGGPSATEMSR